MLSEKTSRKINILSFILFIGVMSIHTYNLDKYEINQNLNPVIAAVETFLNNFANRTCVYFFFMISGFLFFKKFDISLLGYKYKSRGISLVIPYLLWNIIYYLYYVITTRIPLIASLMSNNEKMKIGIASCIRYIWTGYYTLWFLRELIWLTICAPLWYVLLKRRKYYWSEWMLVFLILAGQGVANIPGIKLNIYYILGAYWGMNYKIIVSKWGGTRPLALFRGWRYSAIATMLFLPIYIILGGTYAGELWYNCILFLMIWIAMELFPYKNDILWWVKCTFFYYCSHDMILEAVEKIILVLGGKSVMMAWIDYLLAPMITLLILIIAAWILQKWFPLIWKLLSGGRGDSNSALFVKEI